MDARPCHRVSLLAVFVAAACGPSAGSGDGTSTSGGGGTTGTGATSSGSMTMTSTSAGGDTTGSTGAAESTGTPPELCPEPTAAGSFTVEPDVDLDGLCIVTTSEWEPTDTRVSLDCDGDIVDVHISKPDGGVIPGLLQDMVVRVQYITEPIFWTNRWLAISTAIGESDMLIFGAVEGSSLDPPGSTIDALFASGNGQPIVTIAPADCPVEVDDCGPVQRLGVTATMVDGTTTTVLDGDVGGVNMPPLGYEIIVVEATDRPQPQDCADIAPWRSFMLTRLAGD